MRRIFTALLFGVFVVFCSYCYGTAWRGEKRIAQERAAPPLWGSKKAAIIADLYGIQADELETATNIFGE